MKYHQSIIILPVVLVSLLATAADGQTKQNRFQNTLTGADKCLDIINDGNNNRPTMAKCGNIPGQRWIISASKPNRKFYRLKTPFTGADKCLNVVDDGERNKLVMDKCDNVSGQRWSIVPSKENPGYSGYYLLKNELTGQDKCLDVIDDGRNNRLTIAECSQVSGQSWKINKAP